MQRVLGRKSGEKGATTYPSVKLKGMSPVQCRIHASLVFLDYKESAFINLPLFFEKQ